MVAEYLTQHNVLLNQSRVLDLGSGLGGYTVEWQRLGGDVMALDLTTAPPVVRDAGVPFVCADAQRLPFETETFDLVFCASLIEHVPHPNWLVGEIWRVLRMEGICYLSFPPFYTPRGGHEFSPFHYLGERLAFKLARRDRKIADWWYTYYNITPSAHSFAETFQGWGLYRVTIWQARRWVQEAGFNIRDLSTRFIPVNLAAIPVLGEILAWHVQMLLEKKAT